tara:strand:- start:326 stop:3112 length:2787 start_codon:yes stop_codon:yes gene_type:complete
MFPTQETTPTPPQDNQSVSDALRKITSGWLSKIELSKKSKKGFTDIGEQCTAFFQSAVSFMWEPDFRRKFLGTEVSPNFHVTLNKAFELVSIYGPTLYWQNPQRMLNPRKHIELIPEMFGANPVMQVMLQQQAQQVQEQMQQAQQQIQQMQQGMQQQVQQAQQQGADPQQAQQVAMQGTPQLMQAQQLLQQLQQQQQQIQQQMKQQQQVQQKFEAANADQQSDYSKRNLRSKLLEQWLNYTPVEQPGGGLETHAMRAITESLVKGRGCLMPQSYTMPGSKTKLTGCFYKSVDDLFLDPDATGLGPNECWWMAVKHTQPVWFVERKFGLKGKLSKAATRETKSGFGERTSSDLGSNDRAQGKTQDTITYYEIWSKAGAGHRLSGLKSEYNSAFEKVGDYVRIVVAKGIPYPLNAPPEKVHTATTDELKKIFAWEYPFWKDGRWPVVCLDYWHRVPDKNPQSSAWPIAPLEPGLGELITLNVMISHIVNRTWSASRDFIGVLQSAHKDVEKWLKKGQDMTVFPVKEIYGDINKVVQWVQQPQMNSDMWQAVETLIGLFEKRVGLTELLYGMSATASRSAADTETKRAQMNIRPDHMAKQVEHWMEQCARQEKMVARWSIDPKDIQNVLGKYEAQAWGQLITNAPVEETVREIECTVAAGSVRKPNKERDASNMAQVMQVIMPELSKHAEVTTDTGPINNMISKWGDSIEQDMDSFKMSERTPPPPSPEEQEAQQKQTEMQQQMLELELQILQAKSQGEQQKMASAAELEKAKLQGMAVKAQMDMNKAQTAQQQAEAKSRLDQAKIALAQLQSEIRRDEAQLINETREDQHKLEMLIRNEQRKQQQSDNTNKIRLEQLKQAHEMRLDQEQHEASLMQTSEKHGIDMDIQGLKSNRENETEIEKAQRQSIIDAQKMFSNSQQGRNNGPQDNR